MHQSEESSFVESHLVDHALLRISTRKNVPMSRRTGTVKPYCTYALYIYPVLASLTTAHSINDPVNFMSRYWQNDTCNPLLAPNGTCTLGNMASYAVEVTDAASAAAGIKFARQRSLRLTIKNTGHDYLGRSSGKGSLVLWAHNLNSMEVLNYTSPSYSGPALRMGAGVEAYKAISLASQYGLRVVVGYCVTVSLAGGYSQNGGYGPLGSSYGTASDQTLEFEVITADGRHLVASPTNNTGLYWL